MKLIITILLFFTFSSQALAYKGKPSQQVSSFFSEIAEGKINTAIDNLYSSNHAMQQKLQSLLVMKQQLASISNFFGPFVGHENISREEISPSLIRIVQLAKYENHPVTWEFYFYKTKNQWIVSQAKYDDRYQTLSLK